MKVLLVSPSELPRDGGVNKQVFALARTLGAVGDEVHIAGHAEGSKNLGERVHAFFAADDGTRKRKKLIAEQMRGLLSRESYDVVHVYDPLHSPIGRAVLTWPMLTGRVVATFFGPPQADMPRQRWLARLLARRETCLCASGTKLVATSQSVAQEVRDLFRHEVEVIPVGIDFQRFHPGRKHQEDPSTPLRVLFVGHPQATERGFDLLLAALKRVALRRAVHLEVVGAEPKSLHREAPGLTMTVLGRVTELRMPTLYQQADLVVAPALDKRVTGSALLEAMACGAAVVASDVGPYRELCAGSGAVLFPAGHEEALAAAIGALCDRPEERALRGQANAMAAESYRWDHLVRDVRRLYGALGAAMPDATLQKQAGSRTSVAC